MTPAWIGIGLALGALWVAWQRGWLGGGRRVRDVMVSDVVTIHPAATLQQAAERMRDANVGMLPIVENGRVTGLVTDRDLVVRGLARGADPSSTTVAQCASMQPICARADWDIEQARRVMAEHRIGRLPVVDTGDRLIGIVTLSSLALRSREQEEALQTAEAVSRRSARA